MEHIEEAGVHSGDSACAIPPFSLSEDVLNEIREATCAMARHLRVVGLMNVQFAVKREDGQCQGLCARGQSASESDSAFCGQSYGNPDRRPGRQGHGRAIAG